MDMPFLKLLVSSFVLLTSVNVASSDVDIPAYFDHNCTINNNFTSESPYQYNLNTLLISLYSKATGTDTPKFYNDTVGTPNVNDTVYGEYICRGDVPLEVCQDCVQDATNRIASECTYNREAIIWYDECSVSYSDRYFFSTLHQLPTVNSFLRDTGSRRTDGDCEPIGQLTSLSGGGDGGQCGTRSDTAQKGVSESEYIELNQTLNNAVVEAETSTKRFATKEANLTSGGSLYTLVQCTPDLSPQFCSKCLYGLINLIPSYPTGISGAIVNPFCNLRSEGDRFYYKGNQQPSDYFSQGNIS